MKSTDGEARLRSMVAYAVPVGGTASGRGLVWVDMVGHVASGRVLALVVNGVGGKVTHAHTYTRTQTDRGG